ncbi:hypothetical protein quinque_007892 [Culex quinquefasciatus]
MSPEDEKTCHRAEMDTLTEVDSTGEVFLQAIGNKQDLDVTRCRKWVDAAQSRKNKTITGNVSKRPHSPRQQWAVQ